MASYPSAVATFTNKADGVDIVAAAHVNALQDEVAAIEQGLVNGIAHALLPSANNTRDLGSSALKWRDLYLADQMLVAGAGPHGIGTETPSTRFQVSITGTFNASGGGAHDVGTYMNTTLGVQAGADGTLAYVQGTLNEAGSGTHAIMSGLRIAAPTVGAAGATVNISAALYIEGAAAFAGAANFALYVASGISSFGSGIAETGTITPAQITADQNDYNPTGFSTARNVRLSSDALRTITGLQSSFSGQVVRLVNAGSNDIAFAHGSGSSTATNRIVCPGAATFTLNPGDSIEAWYDGVSSLWRLQAY